MNGKSVVNVLADNFILVVYPNCTSVHKHTRHFVSYQTAGCCVTWQEVDSNTRKGCGIFNNVKFKCNVFLCSRSGTSSRVSRILPKKSDTRTQLYLTIWLLQMVPAKEIHLKLMNKRKACEKAQKGSVALQKI